MKAQIVSRLKMLFKFFTQSLHLFWSLVKRCLEAFLVQINLGLNLATFFILFSFYRGRKIAFRINCVTRMFCQANHHFVLAEKTIFSITMSTKTELFFTICTLDMSSEWHYKNFVCICRLSKKVYNFFKDMSGKI